MKIVLAASAAALALATGALAQSTTSTSVSSDTSVKNGVVTHTHKVVHVHKRKTHHAKRILGVKVGHKTATTKVVKTTSANSNGDVSTTVKTTH
jgi:hypothetical protein